jgi:predicted nuclease with TOPRIM domain
MKDHSGIKETCPWIDEVQTFIDSLEEVPQSEKDAMSNILEEVRGANADLREWGNSLYSEIQDLQSQLDNIERLVDGIKNCF